MLPSAVMHSLKLPMSLSFPDRLVSVLGTSFGKIFLSPETRLSSSAVGATFCGGAGGGGGGGGGGAATTPLRSPPATPPSTPPSTPVGSPVATGGGASCFSIFTGCTMSLTRIFFGVICTSCGFTPPFGGGGGGGGGGAMARSTVFFGRSSCSMSQIVLIHMVRKMTTWSPSMAVQRGPAHLGTLRCLAAWKLWNIEVRTGCLPVGTGALGPGSPAGRDGPPPAPSGFVLRAPDFSSLSLRNGVVFSTSRVIRLLLGWANQPPDFS